MNSTVQRERSCSSATIRPSITATQRARRSRRSRSHRPTRVLPASIMGWLYATSSTVPRWCREPRAAFGGNSLLRGACTVTVQEQPVDGRPSAGDVRTERAKRHQLLRKRGRGEIVRRQCSQVSRPADSRQRSEQGGAAFVVAALASARVELGVDVARGALEGGTRDDEQDPVILRKIEWRELGAVGRSELGTILQEVGHISPELARERTQPAGVQWVVAASELPPPNPAATGMRFWIRAEKCVPFSSARRSSERRTSVSSANPATRSSGERVTAMRSASPTRW